MITLAIADDDEVTFNSGLSAGETVTIYKIRTSSITGFTRSDTVTTASQTVFPFVHDEDTVLQVYKNGILQREGGSNDYVTNAASDTVTFTSAVPSGNTVTVITVENTSTNVVTGLMTEANFADTATGKITFANMQFADGDIPQAKVSGLVSHISTAAAILTVSASTPSAPEAVTYGWTPVKHRTSSSSTQEHNGSRQHQKARYRHLLPRTRVNSSR